MFRSQRSHFGDPTRLVPVLPESLAHHCQSGAMPASPGTHVFNHRMCPMSPIPLHSTSELADVVVISLQYGAPSLQGSCVVTVCDVLHPFNLFSHSTGHSSSIYRLKTIIRERIHSSAVGDMPAPLSGGASEGHSLYDILIPFDPVGNRQTSSSPPAPVDPDGPTEYRGYYALCDSAHSVSSGR